MKRGRGLDLEASVHENDNLDGNGGNSGTSTLDERSTIKKARWMSSRLSEKSHSDPQAGTCSEDLESFGEGHHHVEAVAGRVGHPGAGGVQADEPDNAVPSTNPRPSAASDFQASEAKETVPRAELNAFRDDDWDYLTKSKRKPTGSDSEEKPGGGNRVERTDSNLHINHVKRQKRTYPFPPSVLLYSANVREDAELHSFLSKQAALLSQTEINARLKVISCIGQRIELVKEVGTRKLVTEIVKRQLWKEEDAPAIQGLLKILCSVGLISCARSSDVSQDVDLAQLRAVADVFLRYITTKDSGSRPLKSGTKVQILRSLYQIERAGGGLELDALWPLAKEQLASSNPRLREYGIRLLVEVLKERNALGKGNLDGAMSEFSYNMTNRADGESLIRTLLEFSRDPYPNVRETMLWGILKLHTKGFVLHQSAYKVAVALLKDSFEAVRRSAMKLIGVCVKAFVWDDLQGLQAKYVDNAFMQVCSMMTDMTVTVRQEACNVLAEMTGVSDHALLQSLSRKVLTKSVTEKESGTGGCSASISDGEFNAAASLEECKVLDWSAAGAFVVGLEDEFWEVRSAAVRALAKIATSSEKMAYGAVDLMTDMINDVSSQVRSEAIRALANLARAGRLSVLESHLHTVLSVLEDSSIEMRKSGHNLLSVISLPSIATFQLTTRAAFTSLDKHPEDVASLVIMLAELGKFHPSYTEYCADELLQEFRGLLNGESGVDEPRCIVILALLLGAGTVNSRIVSLIPSPINSITMLLSTKLPRSLPLLQALPLGFKTTQYVWALQNGALTGNVRSRIQSRDTHGSWPPGDASKHETRDVDLENQENIFQSTLTRNRLIRKSFAPLPTEGEESRGSGRQDSGVVEWYHCSRLHHIEEQHILKSAGQIVAIAMGTSLLLEMQAFTDALQRLRGCRKELRTLEGRSVSCGGTVSFYLLYLQCLELLVQLRAIFGSEDSRITMKGAHFPEDILDRLQSTAKHLLHRFLGFSFDVILQVLELHALVVIWRLVLHPPNHPKNKNPNPTSVSISELKSAVSTGERITNGENLHPSPLLKAVHEKLLNEENEVHSLYIWRIARQLALSYRPNLEPLDDPITEMWADLKAPGSNFGQPVGFIAGLPLGIPIDVTLYNIPNMCSLWVQFAQDTSGTGYKFLDVECNSSSNSLGTQGSSIRQISTLLELDGMPSAATSVCRICIVLEGADLRTGIDVGTAETTRGPKGSIIPLCEEMEIHLFLVREKGYRQFPQGKR